MTISSVVNVKYSRSSTVPSAIVDMSLSTTDLRAMDQNFDVGLVQYINARCRGCDFHAQASALDDASTVRVLAT